MTDPFAQAAHAIRLDWGPVGARVTTADIAVVVDVLSFSTAVCVAVERGTAVLPYRWRGRDAERFAAEQNAALAVGRLEATRAGIETPTLSPASLLTGRAVPRLVLPSPNGSTIAAILAEAGAEVIAGCLRNASAVATYLAVGLAQGQSVTILAAGERWDRDDSLRPCVEDLLGAGAIASALGDLGHRDLSPEAELAVVAFTGLRGRLVEMLTACASGIELRDKGFGVDVDLAAALDVSSTVPLLTQGAFISADEH